jgi:eukaryotic-like serine/threonine-protein kinase
MAVRGPRRHRAARHSRRVNKTRWAQLSPLLDELLDLPPAARAERLIKLRAGDAATADALEALLSQLSANERAGFLELPAALPDAGMAGQTLGAYTIDRELGQGGMGSVWLAHRTDGRYEGSVAVKFLNLGLAAHGGAERFAREGSILARLAHPNIARLVDAGVARAGTQPYLVLEYIAGERIDQHCQRLALDVAQRVRLFLDVLAAVAHAHNRLILHRDIKPSNILVTPAGEVKLLDFGIAKLMDDAVSPAQATELTRAAGSAFTPMYAAPEQLQGGDVTTATDVYALGVLLYVLLGGVHPTLSTTSTPVDQLRAVLEAEPKRLSDAVARDGAADAHKRAQELRGDLDNIVAKALKKAPGERYANAALLADDLRRYLADEPVAARPDALSYRTTKFIKRHRVGVAASATVVATLAAGVSVALWQAHEAQLQRIQAEGLIEFMLGDLRKKLQPVGRLDVLDAVGEKSLAYYAAQDAGRLDADSLSRRSRALHLIGEIHETRGKLDDASAAFQRAAETTAQLLAQAPANGQRVFDHAQSVYWVGHVAWLRGNAAEAEASFRQYLALAEQLARLDPNNLDWRVETAYSGQNLGVVYLDSGRPAQALGSFGAARDVLLNLVGARPELYFHLANTQGWIAKALEERGEFEAAIAAQNAKVEALRKMPDGTTNREVQRLVANAGHTIGRLQLALGRAGSARLAARGALAEFDALMKLDPSNLSWLEGKCFVRAGLAEIELALGDAKAAHEQIERAGVDSAQLKPTAQGPTKRQVLLAGRLTALRARLALAGGPGFDVGRLRSFVAAGSAAESAGKSVDAEQARELSSAELLLGDLVAREGASDEASTLWQRAVQRLRKLAEGNNPQALTLLARAELRIGRSAEANLLAERVRNSSYRHPDQAALADELAPVGESGRRTFHQRR